ncbi:hypothetical protein K2W90_05030 [Candidatus Babeliales bacterium]|nr:hypothetical protein [Candidatus Babeliales bacterium]
MNYQVGAFKRFIFSGILFGLIIGFFGLSQTSWGFYFDDFGFILHSKLESFVDLKRIFLIRDIKLTYYPPNLEIGPSDALSALYRPMQYIFFGLQRWAFGLEPLWYYQFTVALHALNAVLIFNILCSFLAVWAAWWASLFFAFHYSLARWFGIFFNQIYVIDLFFLLVISLLLWQFLRSQRVIYYFFSCLLFLVQLLVKETLIVFPAWAFVAVYFYAAYEKKKYWDYEAFKKAFLNALGYGLCAIMYMLIRFYVLPAPAFSPASVDVGRLLVVVKERVFMYVTYLCDVTAISLVPGNNRVLKGILLAGISFLLFYPFWMRKQKMFGLFLVFSTLLFTWPSLIVFHQFCYLYAGLPFFCCLIAYSLDFFERRPRVRFFINCVLTVVVVLCAVRFTRYHKAKREGLASITRQLQVLSTHASIKNRKVCFVGLPLQRFCSGTAQALELYAGQPIDVCYDARDFLMAYDANRLVEFSPVLGNVEVVLEQGMISIKVLDGPYFFKELGACGCFGTFTVHAVNSDGFPVEVSITLDQELLAQNPLFITWDYQKNQLRMLNS